MILRLTLTLPGLCYIYMPLTCVSAATDGSMSPLPINLRLHVHVGHLLALATQHFFLLLQGSRNENVARVARASSATKSLGQCCKIFIELNLLQHVADIGDTWL